MEPNVSDISRQGGQISNEWVKNPLVQSFGRQRARGKQQARPGGLDERARINGTQQNPDPPCLSTFKQEGGVRNQGRISPTVQMSTPGSTTMETIPDPPPAFLPLSRGGGSRIVGTVSNGHNRSIRINGAHAAPLLSAALSLASVGPPPVTSRSGHPPSPVAICHLSIPPL